MILDAARAAAGQLFTAEFRTVFLKTLGITLLALVALWFGLKEVFDWLALPWIDALLPGLPSWAGWLGFIAAVLAGIGLALGLALLIAPVTATGRRAVPRRRQPRRWSAPSYPFDPPGRAGAGFALACPGAEILRRRHSRQSCRTAASADPRRQHRRLLPRQRLSARPRILRVRRHALPARGGGQGACAGNMPARCFWPDWSSPAFLAVPLLNLLTPLFAAAMMVHLHKMLRHQPTREAANLGGRKPRRVNLAQQEAAPECVVLLDGELGFARIIGAAADARGDGVERPRPLSRSRPNRRSANRRCSRTVASRPMPICPWRAWPQAAR